MNCREFVRMLGLILCAATLVLGQDASFQIKRMREWNESAREGRCVLRVAVDDAVDVELQRDTVLIRRISGQPGRDNGSECTQPLPQSFFTRFAFRGMDGRGEVRLTQEPRPGNAFTAIVSIRDLKAGEEGYTFELTWVTDGQPYQGSVGGRTGTATSGGYFGASDNSSPASGGAASGTSNSTSSSPSSGGILPSLSGLLGPGNTPSGATTAPATPSNPSPSQPSAQSFAGLNETAIGTGSLRIGSRNDNLRRARVILQANGEAEIQLYSTEVVTLRGRWSGQPGVLNLEIREGFAGGLSNGSGRVTLAADGRLSSLEVQGTMANSQDSFEIRFRRE